MVLDNFPNTSLRVTVLEGTKIDGDDWLSMTFHTGACMGIFLAEGEKTQSDSATILVLLISEKDGYWERVGLLHILVPELEDAHTPSGASGRNLGPLKRLERLGAKIEKRRFRIG